jgi:hypothetical protein
MSDFLNGIGFGDDLKPIELSDGYAKIKSGYAYINNVEYYILSSGTIVPITSDTIEDLPYMLGSPYFVVDSATYLKTGNGFKYIDTSYALQIESPNFAYWDMIDDEWIFKQSGFTGKYLIYDGSDSFEINKSLVESPYLVLSDDETEPYEIVVSPVISSTTTEGSPLKFLSKVYDNNGALLENIMVDWYKVYEVAPSGVLTETLIVSSTTDVNGVASVELYVTSGEEDVCVCAKYGDVVSNLCWIQVNVAVNSQSNIFQFDNSDVFLIPQDVYTAIGYDAWGNFWASGTLTEGYDGIITGQPERYPYNVTRGDWKEYNANFRRPPLTIVNYDGIAPLLPQESDDVDEVLGIWNIEDFALANDIGYGDIDNFINSQYVAVQGYWGQVIIDGYDIRNVSDFNDHCLNKFDISAIGSIWEEKNVSGYWYDVAISASGSIMTAVKYSDGIHVSNDGGDTWTETLGSNWGYTSVDISASGTIQAVVVDNNWKVFISTDSGSSWSQKGSNGYYSDVAVSADGSIITIVTGRPQSTQITGYIYVSTDTGDTWTQKGSVKCWTGIAMSADGTKQTAVVYGGQIYVSTDTGNTWVAKDSNRNWYSVAMSADGSIQTAVALGHGIYVSTDGGNTWSQKEGNRGWVRVDMSADGSIQTAVEYNGQIYVSTDTGDTWLPKESVRGWKGVAVSADGSIMAAAPWDDQIYVSSHNDLMYTIYHLDSSGTINIWGNDSNQFGIKGSWNDIYNEETTKYDSLYYVLYCPGYQGSDPEYFKTHDFYFRGLALMNTDSEDVDYLKQDYTIYDLITDTPLQGY